jgi:hypothetical protein
MKSWIAVLVAGALLAVPAGARADEAKLTFGGDQYNAGQTTAIDASVARDAFMAGYDVSLKAPVEGDAHIAGYNVGSEGSVAGDLYAAGFAVNVTGTVGADVTAFGNSIGIRNGANVAGNARLAAQTVTLAAPIAGSVLVAAQSLSLDSAIAGDFEFIGETLTFGPNAKVGGKVILQAPKEIPVPAEVASSDRVTFTQLTNPDYVSETRRTAESVVRGFWPAFWAGLAFLVLLVLVGAALIALLPKLVAGMEDAGQRRPFRTIGLGILAFSSTLGLVIVAALTLIGLLVVPFVLIYIFVACALAFVVGAYLIGARIGSAFVKIDTNLKRLGLLAVALVAATLLGMIPVVGWLVTLLIVCFGFGAFTIVTIERWASHAPQTVAAPTPATA